MYFISFCAILLIISSSYGLALPSTHEKLEGCSCDDIICPKDVTTECVAGIVTDICDCCPNGVCGQREGQRCYHPQSIDEDRKYGICGAEMLCTFKEEEQYTSNIAESTCVCKDERTVCGSNNKTYDTPCQLKEDVVQDPTIHIQYWGSCKTGPNIVTAPQDGAVDVNRDVFLDCEIHGNPVPLVRWEFLSGAGLLKSLPGDDPNIVVQTRGGPENLMVTSYLQIFQMRETDVGTYICSAENSHGKTQASARITMK